MASPYSFRYPFDVQSTLEPWRHELGHSFDDVVAHLSDRDRALEDYLALGIGQGYLGYALATGLPQSIGSTETAVSGLSVTVAVPASRVLKLTSQGSATNTAATGGTSQFRIRDESSVLQVFDSFVHAASGSAGANHTYLVSAFVTPTAGVHTYQTSLKFNSTGTVSSTTGNDVFLSVEDVGPVSR